MVFDTLNLSFTSLKQQLFMIENLMFKLINIFVVIY